MAKMTKEQYQARITKLQRFQETNSRKIEEWHQWMEKNPNSPEWQDKNYLYDRKYAIKQLIDSVHHQWETRDWTAAEWNSYNLMINNID